MQTTRTLALARSQHGALLAAIIAVLVGGIIAAIILPTAPSLRATQEGGSLLAPPSDESLSAGFGAPGVPSDEIGAFDPAARSGGTPDDDGASPSPSPSPGPKSDTPQPPPEEDEGLLGLLPDLPILPPLLPPKAAAPALERVARAGDR